MNILIVFETYSGGTMAAAQYVSKILLQKNHTVTLKRANEIELGECTKYDFIFMATPSWLENGQEGQPHLNFIKLLEQGKNISLQGKKFAIFGLGDETYAHFGRGADILANTIQERGGEIVSKPLKIDSYYVDPEKHEKQLTEWLDSLPLQ